MKLVLRDLRGLTLLALILCSARIPAQTVPDKPIPDIPTMMHEVEAHQKASESIEKDYLYHSFATEQALDGHGGVKKTETQDADIFYVAGARIRRMTKKNGRDLSPEEQKKESQRIDKRIEEAKKRQANSTDMERDVVTVSRFLELGSFSNPRRVTLNGRDTIAVDFTGDPKAKPHTRFEGAIREMQGTVWVDEQDRSLRKLQGRFVNDFKVGGGLLADIKKNSRFEAEWTKINGEVWLPSSASGQGDVRLLLLLNIHGSLQVVNSNYRKFKATATILPMTEKDSQETPTPPTGAPPQ